MSQNHEMPNHEMPNHGMPSDDPCNICNVDKSTYKCGHCTMSMCLSCLMELTKMDDWCLCPQCRRDLEVIDNDEMIKISRRKRLTFKGFSETFDVTEKDKFIPNGSSLTYFIERFAYHISDNILGFLKKVDPADLFFRVSNEEQTPSEIKFEYNREITLPTTNHGLVYKQCLKAMVSIELDPTTPQFLMNKCDDYMESFVLCITCDKKFKKPKSAIIHTLQKPHLKKMMERNINI